MRRLAVAFLLLAGCRTPAPASQQDDAGGDAAAAASPKARGIDVAALAIADAPSAAQPLPAGKPLALPGEFVARIGEPARWVVANGKKMSVVDRASGRVLGSIDGAYRDGVDRSNARLDGWHGPDKSLALMTLADGRVHIPRARLADGTRVKVEHIVSEEAVTPIYVFGADATEKHHFGVWKIEDGDDVLLDRPSPAVGTTAVMFDSVSKRLVVFADGAPKPEECAAAFFDEKGSNCFLHGRDYDGSPLHVLHGGIVARGSMLMDMLRHREASSTLGERPAPAALLDAPPRALVAITEGKADGSDLVRRKLEILGPGGSAGTFHLDVKSDASTFSSVRCSADKPVVAEEAFSQVPASAVFIDLARENVVRLPVAVDTLARKMLPRRFIAVERGASNDALVVVDLTKSKASRLGTMPKCPGPYWASADDERYASLVCSRRPDPNAFAMTHLWSEIVALDTAKRWHFDGDVLDVSPSGEALVAAPASFNAEGGSAAHTGLRLVKLE